MLLSFPTPAVSGCYFRGDAHGACGGDIQEDGPEAGPGHKERVRNAAAMILAHSTLQDRAPCNASVSVLSSRFWKVGLMCNKSGSEIRDSSPTTRSIFLTYCIACRHAVEWQSANMERLVLPRVQAEYEYTVHSIDAISVDYCHYSLSPNSQSCLAIDVCLCMWHCAVILDPLLSGVVSL